MVSHNSLYDHHIALIDREKKPSVRAEIGCVTPEFGRTVACTSSSKASGWANWRQSSFTDVLRSEWSLQDPFTHERNALETGETSGVQRWQQDVHA